MTWGGEAAEAIAEDVLEAIGNALQGVVNKILEDPSVILFPAGSILLGKTAWEATKTLGKEIGFEISKQVIPQEEENGDTRSDSTD